MPVILRFRIIVPVLLCGILNTLQAQNFDRQIPSLIIGKSHKIYSYVLEEDRTILVHLPKDYEIGVQNYPVLYLLDGEQHFQHVVSSVDFLSQHFLIPPMIVVGLVNVDRTRDFTPYKSYDSQFPSAGKADNFMKFLKRELFPWVKNNFKQSNDYKIIAGHSFGGLFAIYSLIKQPKLFDAYLSISPSLWWNDELYVDVLSKNLIKAPLNNKRIFLAWGQEGSKIESPSKRLAKILKVHSAESFYSNYAYMEQESHETIVNRAVYTGLQDIFAEWSLHELVDLKGLKAHYRSIHATWGFDAIPPEDQIDNLAYQWISKKQINHAIDLFTYNVEVYQSAFAYYRLGEVYEITGGGSKAQKAYITAYEIALKTNDPYLERYRFKIE